MNRTALLVAAAIAAPSSADILTFQAFNHPAGVVPNQDYGVRLDGFSTDGVTTFSMENGDGSSAVTITIDTDIGGGLASLSIEGTIFGNSADGGTDLGSFTLSMQYEGVWDASNELFTSAVGNAASGTLTGLATTAASPLANGEALDLGAKDKNDAFFYFGRPIPGSRLSGLDQANLFEGQGWLMSDLSHQFSDFLFTAVPTVNPPAPGAAALVC
ncbi:MAG: hypothetical protein AAFU70_10840, partial [Planctomycetota bacterium]